MSKPLMCVYACVQNGYRPVDVAADNNHCDASKFLTSVVWLDTAGFAKALGHANSAACKVRVNVRVCACVLCVCVCVLRVVWGVCAYLCVRVALCRR